MIDGDAETGTLKVVIPGADVELLRGATLHHTDAPGLVIRNPNRPATPDIEGLKGDAVGRDRGVRRR